MLRDAASEAEIEIDGKLVGLSPLPRLRISSGPHTLRVSKRGFIAVAQDALVAARDGIVRENERVPIALEHARGSAEHVSRELIEHDDSGETAPR